MNAVPPPSGAQAQQDNYRCGGLDLRGVPQQLLDCDRPCFPSGRADFLRAWVHQPGHHALGLLHQGRLAAYGVMRPCLQGHKIGPLIAGGATQAQALLGAAGRADGARARGWRRLPGRAPQPNAAAVALAEGCGMAPMFETARMYKGAPLLPDMRGTFGIGTFELG